MSRPPLVILPGQGRAYPMGRMRAVFKADGPETASTSSVSEWWLEPRTEGPPVHDHPEDHVFYVIEGCLSVLLDGAWSEAPRGAYVVIPGGTAHSFENRTGERAGFISFNTPGGFERQAGAIQAWFADHPLGDASG